jgi:hypothetical protein
MKVSNAWLCLTENNWLCFFHFGYLLPFLSFLLSCVLSYLFLTYWSGKRLRRELVNIEILFKGSESILCTHIPLQIWSTHAPSWFLVKYNFGGIKELIVTRSKKSRVQIQKHAINALQLPVELYLRDWFLILYFHFWKIQNWFWHIFNVIEIIFCRLEKMGHIIVCRLP